MNRVRQCTQDIIDLAQTGHTDNEISGMKARIEQFFADLTKFKSEWPNQDVEQYINRLDETMTAASTQLDTPEVASDLLEQAIDYLAERRQRRHDR